MKKLNTAADNEIANGDNFNKPAPSPFVRAFIDIAIPRTIDSKKLIFPDLSRSAFSGDFKYPVITFETDSSSSSTS